MRFMPSKIAVASLIFVAALAAQAKGQDAITPEKRALIAEMLQVVESKKTSEEIMSAILLQLEKDVPEMMRRSLAQEMKNRQLSEKEEKELDEHLVQTSSRVLARLRELFAKRVNFGEVLEQISYPLYDKFFSEAELKDLIGFYKTPTGRKAVRVMPELMNDAIQRSNALLMPRITELIDEIKEEQLKEIDKAIKQKN